MPPGDDRYQKAVKSLPPEQLARMQLPNALWAVARELESLAEMERPESFETGAEPRWRMLRMARVQAGEALELARKVDDPVAKECLPVLDMVWHYLEDAEKPAEWAISQEDWQAAVETITAGISKAWERGGVELEKLAARMRCAPATIATIAKTTRDDFTLRVLQTAKRLDVNRGEIQRFVKSGTLKDNGKTGRARRISEKSVRKLERDRKRVHEESDEEVEKKFAAGIADLRNEKRNVAQQPRR